MAVLKVEFDNILCFNGFKADFTYKKKLVKPLLDEEYLRDFPNIRYKKVNIIIGSNASGKTALGKAIWVTLRFLCNKEAERIKEVVADKDKEAYILLDSIHSNGEFFRAEIKVSPTEGVLVRYNALTANKTDSYNSLIKRLDLNKPFRNYVVELENAIPLGWNFLFPTIETGFDKIYCKVNEGKERDFLKVFEPILKTFDPSIKEVNKSSEQQDSYMVHFFDGRSIRITNGESLSALNGLSSGTKYAINVASLIYAIQNHENGFYYADEQFSYADSEIEVHCLSAMIAKLGDGEQLFFTTHNKEILKMSLPMHSFNFIKKEIENGISKITLINPADFEKRNNVTVNSHYQNDFFDIMPNVDFIDSLGVNEA